MKRENHLFSLLIHKKWFNKINFYDKKMFLIIGLKKKQWKPGIDVLNLRQVIYIKYYKKCLIYGGILDSYILMFAGKIS